MRGPVPHCPGSGRRHSRVRPEAPVIAARPHKCRSRPWSPAWMPLERRTGSKTSAQRQRSWPGASRFTSITWMSALNSQKARRTATSGLSGVGGLLFVSRIPLTDILSHETFILPPTVWSTIQANCSGGAPAIDQGAEMRSERDPLPPFLEGLGLTRRADSSEIARACQQIVFASLPDYLGPLLRTPRRAHPSIPNSHRRR